MPLKIPLIPLKKGDFKRFDPLLFKEGEGGSEGFKTASSLQVGRN